MKCVMCCRSFSGLVLIIGHVGVCLVLKICLDVIEIPYTFELFRDASYVGDRYNTKKVFFFSQMTVSPSLKK
jgi:hypothetical protein